MRFLLKFILPLVALALLVFAFYHVFSQQKTEANVAPPIEPPRSPFSNTVAGSAIVEAQTENISIGSALAGVVVEVNVKVGREVVADAPLFRLDDREQRAELLIRKSALASAQAALNRLKNQPRSEELPVTRAAVDHAKAALLGQQDQLKRIRPLVERNVATEEDLVTREQAVRMAQAELEEAEASLKLLEAGAWSYDLEVAEAAVQEAQAQIEQVETELDRLIVRTQVDGEVLQVNVRPGEFVAAPANEALVVLGNVKRLHARVDIDEYDIPRFTPTAPATAMIRGQVDDKFDLTFIRVEPFVVPKRSLTGDSTERVDTRVLQVIYSLEPGDNRLYVGQQLDVFIESADSIKKAGDEAPPATVEAAQK